MTNVTAELKNAELRFSGDHFWVTGYIYGDSRNRWPDGTYIHTSAIQKLDDKKNLVVTRNSVYQVLAEDMVKMVASVSKGLDFLRPLDK